MLTLTIKKIFNLISFHRKTTLLPSRGISAKFEPKLKCVVLGSNLAVNSSVFKKIKPLNKSAKFEPTSDR